jgi:hypothetical protein
MFPLRPALHVNMTRGVSVCWPSWQRYLVDYWYVPHTSCWLDLQLQPSLTISSQPWWSACLYNIFDDSPQVRSLWHAGLGFLVLSFIRIIKQRLCLMTTWSMGPCKFFDDNPHIMSPWRADFLVSNDIFCQYHKTKRPHLIPTWSVGPCNFFDDNPHIRSPWCAGVGFLAISFVNITKQWDCTSWRHKAWVSAIFLMIVRKSGHPDVWVFGFLWYILSISYNNEPAPHDNMMHRSMLYFWWYSASQVLWGAVLGVATRARPSDLIIVHYYVCVTLRYASKYKSKTPWLLLSWIPTGYGPWLYLLSL